MPVTVTAYAPVLPEHDSVEVPEVPSVTLEGVNVQVSPVAGETVSVRVTDPVKPWRDVTVMVEVPEVPAGIVTLVGLAETVKSWIV